MNKPDGTGKRFNSGKTRHGLCPPYAQEQYAKVWTLGAEKYGPHNWEKGMHWSTVIDSLERHINAFKRGEDYDPETEIEHTAHIMCNAAMLTEYYKIFPQGDDRVLPYHQKKSYGIDIDDVLADFIGGYRAIYDIPQPRTWNFDHKFDERYKNLLKSDKFWLDLKTILSPQDLPFVPAAYVTARPEELSKLTRQWLFEVNDYPVAPVIHTTNKAEVCKQYNFDIFIDDNVANFQDITTNSNTVCYLFDSSHNDYIDVGHKRIRKETLKRLL